MDWNVVEIVIITVITVLILYVFWISGVFLIIIYPILYFWAKIDKKKEQDKEQITVNEE